MRLVLLGAPGSGKGMTCEDGLGTGPALGISYSVVFVGTERRLVVLAKMEIRKVIGW